MRNQILASITILIIGGIPAAASAQRIDCLRQGDLIQLASIGEARNRNGDRTFTLQDLLGIFR